MMAQRGSRGIALLFLDLGTLMGVCGQHHAPAALPPGKNIIYIYITTVRFVCNIMTL